MRTTPKPEGRVRRAWPLILAWIGGITAVLGFLGTISGTFSKVSGFLHHNGDRNAKLHLAEGQVERKNYAEALQTYAAALKDDPSARSAHQGQLLAAELLVEDFTIDDHAAAANTLDQVFPILDSALINAKGSEAADIQAHLGWAHWLNSRVAMRETPSVAVDSLNAALATDPDNVYANAMFGRVTIKVHGDLQDANRYLQRAVTSGKQRPFVRKFQLESLLFDEETGARNATMKVANEMRLSNEPLDENNKLSILSFCFLPSSFHKDLVEALTALPPAETLETYKWLDQAPSIDPKIQNLNRRYIEASILEVTGQREAALTRFRALDPDVQGSFTTLEQAVPEAIERLSKH